MNWSTFWRVFAKPEGIFDHPKREYELQELNAHMARSDFWNDSSAARHTAKRAEQLRIELNEWSQLEKNVSDTLALAQEEHAGLLKVDIEEDYKRYLSQFEKLEFLVLMNGLYDEHSTVLSIHAGTGGVDAQDWAEMLFRMYTRFAEKKNWSTEVVDMSRGMEAGIKSVTLKIEGRYAYGYLKAEAGVHRLVRISPFDAEGMRHTSFALVDVVPELPDIGEIDIPETDLRIDVYRSSGHGGQSVNTTDSAVRIVHIPTNITVTCQNERSQHQNKATAMMILRGKLAQRLELEREKEERILRGEVLSAEWGNQIRSYVVHPYKLVKDHRTEYESTDPQAVLGGELDAFVEAYLRWRKQSS
ncbi:MAG: Peptide chain release factor 2 [Parcubacteria group bacterium GW2011_GWA2_43_13]|nr:MAG: Peptide chain release factor 2 [Parcubacteria group bacterium GW2011_GWA2_43_13]